MAIRALLASCSLRLSGISRSNSCNRAPHRPKAGAVFCCQRFWAALLFGCAGIVLGIIFRIDLRHFLVGPEAHHSRAVQCLLKIDEAITPDTFAPFKGEERAVQFHYARIVIVYDAVTLQSAVGVGVSS